MVKYIRKSVRYLKPYTPGEQPGTKSKVIKLNTNENPYPPSPRVLKVLRKINGEVLRKYPEPLADSFRKIAGRIFKIDPDMIIAGNGSDEILTIIFRTFVEEKDKVAYPVPTYSLYPVLVDIQGARKVEIPFPDDFSLPKELADVDVKIIFIANPNAPSGTFIKPGHIETLVKKVNGKSLVVIDEAYVDFAEDNCIELAKKYSNVIVLRTLSKGYALAGLRFGFAFADKRLINEMMKVKDSYNCDAISIRLAIEAISDQRWLRETVGKIKSQREWLREKFIELGFNVRKSYANFLWVEVGNERKAKGIYDSLKRRGILVRYFDKKGLRDGLRITVGRPSENRKLIKEIQAILGAQDAKR